MEILVTGGAGFIGSHTLIALIHAGYTPIVIDNLCNANPIVLDRVAEITGVRPRLYEKDIRDRGALRTIFEEHTIEAVIHFAGLKAVGESTEIPLEYYQNNVTGTLVLCEEMRRAGVFRLVFSSSATVYGDPETVPIPETARTTATNPYGRSKLFIEEILRDLVASDDRWGVVLLRYFNPVGAHPSGRIGEDPKGIPNNLLPYITQVAVGKLKELAVFGDDYETADGTGVRDYIHILDLADGHVKALKRVDSDKGVFTYNLGTGTGYSVLEMVKAFEEASGARIPYRIAPRRPGDIAACFAHPERARKEMGWEAVRGLQEMMRDAWAWQSQNPDGYPESSD